DLDIDVEDTALVHLEFESGALASVSLDYLQQSMQHNFQIVGSKGVIRFDYTAGAATLQISDRITKVSVSEQFQRNDMFVSEMNHFFDCIDRRAEAVCPIRDGATTLRTCLAALESARTGSRIDV